MPRSEYSLSTADGQVTPPRSALGFSTVSGEEAPLDSRTWQTKSDMNAFRMEEKNEYFTCKKLIAAV